MLLLTIATPALAHPGHGLETGLFAGLAHPLTGLDHLLTMLMVGLWSAIAFPKRVWACPTAFVAFMLAGFAFGTAGGQFPIAEMLILASLAGLGLALLLDIRLPIAVALPVIALFAVGHGFAHGSEMSPGQSGVAFAAGFVATTIALHLAGIALTRIATPRIAQTAGLVAAATAVTMWAS